MIYEVLNAFWETFDPFELFCIWFIREKIIQIAKYSCNSWVVWNKLCEALDNGDFFFFFCRCCMSVKGLKLLLQQQQLHPWVSHHLMMKTTVYLLLKEMTTLLIIRTTFSERWLLSFMQFESVFIYLFVTNCSIN